jgi:hypothetical protein
VRDLTVASINPSANSLYTHSNIIITYVYNKRAFFETYALQFRSDTTPVLVFFKNHQHHHQYFHFSFSSHIRSLGRIYSVMHGRAKLERPPSAQELEADQQKSAAYSKLVVILQTLKSNGDRSEQTLELSGQMLRKNPDYYSLWNFRREILISNNANIGLAIKMDTKINSEGGMTIAEKELRLSQEAIIKNPKSYGAWYHRVWIIDRFEVDISSEIGE